EDAFFVQRGDRRQLLVLAEFEVLGPAPGGDVDDAGAFRLADRLPGDDAVRRPRRDRLGPLLLERHAGNLGRIAARIALGRQLVERAVVLPADHRRTGQFALDLEA